MNNLAKKNDDLENAEDIIDHEIKLIKESCAMLNIKFTQLIKDIINSIEKDSNEDKKEKN